MTHSLTFFDPHSRPFTTIYEPLSRPYDIYEPLSKPYDYLRTTRNRTTIYEPLSIPYDYLRTTLETVRLSTNHSRDCTTIYEPLSKLYDYLRTTLETVRLSTNHSVRPCMTHTTMWKPGRNALVKQ